MLKISTWVIFLVPLTMGYKTLTIFIKYVGFMIRTIEVLSNCLAGNEEMFSEKLPGFFIMLGKNKSPFLKNLGTTLTGLEDSSFRIEQSLVRASIPRTSSSF